jgi:hypothetical protein
VRVGRQRTQEERREMLHERAVRLQHWGAELHNESQSPESRQAMPVMILEEAYSTLMSVSPFNPRHHTNSCKN